MKSSVTTPMVYQYASIGKVLVPESRIERDSLIVLGKGVRA